MGPELPPHVVISAELEALAPLPLQSAVAVRRIAATRCPLLFSYRFPDVLNIFSPWDSHKNTLPTLKLNCGKAAPNQFELARINSIRRLVGAQGCFVR